MAGIMPSEAARIVDNSFMSIGFTQSDMEQVNFSDKITAFKKEYNHFRPHSALGNLTPVEALSRHHRSSETLL